MGWAVFTDGKLTNWGQTVLVRDGKVSWEPLLALFEDTKPTEIVCENYRVYQHKLSQHSNSEVVTVRIIGAIDLIWYTRSFGYEFNRKAVHPMTAEDHREIVYQMASMAKGFCKDGKLKEWGYWKEGMRHSRDAIRHGCYYLLFHNRR